LNRLNLVADTIALLTPIVGLPVRYVLKGGPYAAATDTAWEIMAGILLAVTFLKLVCHWQENAQLHSKLMGENISIVGIADDLMADQSKLTADLPALRQLLGKSEAEDSDLLGEPKEADKQWAYREALKEADKINAKCPVCSRSAWKFKNKWWQFWGDDNKCQACGNTD
jgi:mobilome CxxCx(11)CxxC protein